MKAHIASLINAVALIVFGTWGYLGSDSPSITALIPVIFGVFLVVLYPGVKKENKVVAHIAVVLTLLILFGLAMPLRGAVSRDDNAAVIRVVLMMLSTIFSIVFFIKSFIDARKARQ